jgi:spoIIIJ-associated protein
MEWVEAVGKTVDEAVSEALNALGETSKDSVDIEVVEEPKKGFLGMGGQEAKVRVTMRPKKKRRRGRGRSRERGDRQQGGAEAKAKGKRTPKPDGAEGQTGRQQPKGKDTRNESKNRRNKPKRAGSGGADTKKVAVDTKPEEKADIEEQAQVAREFAEGLLEAFGVEGDVATRIEALVGRKGAVVQAVHELTRTVIQRKTFGAPRMRLDIAGYAARRREALKIYAARLAETVKEDGREAMLESMNAADRKVVHDAIGEIEGVRSYSEGEEPNRSVVVAPAD